MTGNGAAAAAYARAGWPVFPAAPDNPACPTPDCCGCKAPLTRHGLRDAETSLAVIARWWARHPDANIAIATGAPGPDVLDVDITHGRPGYKSLNEAIRAGLVPSPAAAIRTGTGGIHLYYAGDQQRNGTLREQGLDFRATGGYVIAPPSAVHGRPYIVVSHGGEPASIDYGKICSHFQPQPQRPALQSQASRGQHGVDHLPGWLAKVPAGGRNDALFWAACRAAEAGDESVLAGLAAAARGTGLADQEIAATIASARRTAGQRHAEHQGGREAAS